MGQQRVQQTTYYVKLKSILTSTNTTQNKLKMNHLKQPIEHTIQTYVEKESSHHK